jgi:nucleoside-diphosphate-sugar epimerase
LSNGPTELSELVALSGEAVYRAADYSGARFLVTGGSGFLGHHIVQYLTDHGANVVAGVRHASQSGDRKIVLDVTDKSAIEVVFEDVRPTHIINCAAYGVDQGKQVCADAFRANVGACHNLIHAASRLGVSRFIHVGTCSEYASSQSPILESAPQEPHNIYALSKAAGTLAVLELGAVLDIDVSVVRPFGLWGLGEPGFRVIPQVVAACRDRSPLALTDCDLVRDYSYVADAAGWISSVAVCSKMKSGTIVNIGSGVPVVLRDFVLAVADLLGGTELMEFGKRPQRPNEPKSVVADITRLKQLIGPIVHTPLEKGLSNMLEVARQ